MLSIPYSKCLGLEGFLIDVVVLGVRVDFLSCFQTLKYFID